MATTKNPNKPKKPQTDWQKVWSRPIVIDGVQIDEQTLAEFLDWKLANGSEDFKMFMHLKNTGYFKTNPVTSAQLTAAVAKKAVAKKTK